MTSYRSRCLLGTLAFVLYATSGFGQGISSLDKVDSLLQRAKEAGEHGRLRESTEIYKQVLAIRPEWVPAMFDLAVAYHFARDYPHAIPLLNHIIQRQPDMAQAYLLRGIDYYQTNQFQLALRSLGRASELQGHKNPEALFFLGASYYQLNDFRNAALAYLDQLAIQPESSDAYFQLIECYERLRKSGFYSINSDPRASYYVLLLEGKKRLALNDIEGAHSQISAALQIDAQSPEAWWLSSLMDGQAGQQERSIEDLSRARAANGSLDPEFQGIVDATYNQKPNCGNSDALATAICHAASSNLGDATRITLSVTASHPNDLRVLYWATQIYDRLLDATFTRLREVAPNSPNLLRTYARAFDQKGQREEAAQTYEKAIGLDRRNASLLVEYANFLSRSREFEKSLTTLREAAVLTPYDDKLQLLLAEAYIQNQQTNRAIPHFRRALAADGSNVNLRLELAQALQAESRTPEAIAVLRAAPSDLDGRISYMLATYYARTGEREKARLAMKAFQEKKQSAPTP